MEAFDKVAEMSFHGISYIIKISAKENGLYIEIEEKETGDVWKSSFPASYIEEITQKTGNFKKFDVFAKMLQSAVSKASESVFIDILSAHDLEMMKAKNQKQTVTKPATVPKNAKRYIILTYSVEYDKVHYPLPLNYEETPNVPALKNTIKQLRSEVDTLKTMLNKNSSQNNDGFFMTAMGDTGNTSDVQALKAENEALKERLKKIDSLEGTSPMKLGAVELDMMMKSKLDLETELETLKKDYVRDVKRMKAKLEEVDGDRKAIFEELTKLKNQAAEQGLIDTTRRNQTASKEDSDPSFLKKLMLKHQKEADKYRKEVESFRIMDNKQKARIKQLEMDLQAATRGAGGRNKGASPVYPRTKDLSIRISDNKRSTSVTKSLSPSFKLTVPNRASAKPMPTTNKSMVGSGSMGGNLKQRNQISPLGRSPPVDRRVSPPRSNLNDPYSNRRSPLNKPHYLSPLNSKVSPSNKLGGLGYNNYLVNSPNAYGSGSKMNEKSRHIQLSGNLDSVKQSLMIMGSGSGPLSSKGDAPGNLSIVSQSNIKHNLQEHYMDLTELKNNKTVEHTSGDPLLNSDEVGGLNKKLNKLQDLFKNAKS